jgi:hypothetical protein
MGINNINLIILKDSFHPKNGWQLPGPVHSNLEDGNLQTLQFFSQNTPRLTNGNRSEAGSIDSPDDKQGPLCLACPAALLVNECNPDQDSAFLLRFAAVREGDPPHSGFKKQPSKLPLSSASTIEMIGIWGSDGHVCQKDGDVSRRKALAR